MTDNRNPRALQKWTLRGYIQRNSLCLYINRAILRMQAIKCSEKMWRLYTFHLLRNNEQHGRQRDGVPVELALIILYKETHEIILNAMFMNV